MFHSDGRRRQAPVFHPSDLAVIGYSAFMTVLAVACAGRTPMWPAVVGTSVLVIAGLSALAVADAHLGWRAVRFLHNWAFAAAAYFLYLETHWVVGPVRGDWLADDLLIAIDRAIFGANPLEWFGHLARPWLTELSQVAYTLFYPLVVAVGAEIYVRRSEADFQRFSFACACGFLGSYVGYLLVPAVGPRFTIYDISSIGRDLPGLLLTPSLREFVNAGGLVPAGVPNAVARSLALRDAFPSGHTMMTLVSVWWSWRMRLSIRWAVTAVGALLVFATMYLRYHYVIDVLAGAALAAALIGMLPSVWRWTVSHLPTRPCDESLPALARSGSASRV
jgi:membrane-associated phospholipid phosphatase